MSNRRPLCLLVTLPLAVALCTNWCAPLPAVGNELPSIFNGDDLSGWAVPKDNVWWRVEDGVLHAQNDPDNTGSLLWTKRKYGNFVMEFQFKMVQGRIDSGVFVRNQNDQIQIGISGSLNRDMTGSPYIGSAKGYPVEAEHVNELLKVDDWNDMTIAAIGNTYSVWLNGKQVLNYHSATASEHGPIGLQVHPGCTMTIDFRNIRLAELN